ncbi:hypothetical protein BSKO_12934 [Bryopsis sp. KO-2023]|nr:hypothetical protein BSKO_12934 [Bryopsis sp. KO-2023]
MRVTRAAEDPSIAFSPRPNFPRPRGNNKNRVVREMAKPARRLNLVTLASTGRPSGSLTPRVASARLSPRRMQNCTQQVTAGACVQGLGAETLSDELGYPIRPSAALPVGVFVGRPYTVPKRSDTDHAKTDEEAQLWHLKRAMGSLRCFELQWGLVRSELEAALAEHKKGAEIQFGGDATVESCELQNDLKDLKETKMVFEAQARSAKSGEAVGGLLHDLHENRAAFIQRVHQLKGSVMGALEEMKGVTIGQSRCSGNTKKLTEYMHQALDILSAMDTMVSQEKFATKSIKKSDLLNALGKVGRFAATQQEFGSPSGGNRPEVLFANSPSERGVQRVVKTGMMSGKKTKKLMKEHLQGAK